MDRPLPFVDVGGQPRRGVRAADSGDASAVIATRGGRPVGVVTKLDVLEYLTHRPTPGADDVGTGWPSRRSGPSASSSVSMSLAFMQLLVARDLDAAEAEIGAVVPEDLPDDLDNSSSSGSPT